MSQELDAQQSRIDRALMSGARVAEWQLEQRLLKEELEWHSYVLYNKGDSVLLMAKVTAQSGKKYVAFSRASTAMGAFRKAYALALTPWDWVKEERPWEERNK